MRFVRLLIAVTAIAALAVVGIAVFAHYRAVDRLDLAELRNGIGRWVERSDRIRQAAAPDYQTRVLAGMPANPNTGAFLRLADGLDSARAAGAATDARHDDAGVLLALEFDGNDPTEMRPFKGRSVAESSGGMLSVVNDPGDYLTNTEPLGLDKESIADIVLRARLAKGTEMRLGWPEQDRPDKTFKYNLTVDVVPDGEFHTYSVNAANALKRGLRFGATLDELLLRPSNADGDRVEIDYVRFISKLARYRQQPHGRAYETLGHEMRDALYMLAPQTLTFDIDVPAEDPRLDLGTGVLLAGRPMRMAVHVEAEDNRTTVLDRTVSNSAAWENARIDLAPWSGKRVRLVLETQGAADNVALWSAPVVSAAPPRRRNVVLILEDTLRADHLTVHGYRARPTSPFKERLAADGAIFEHAFSQATMTRPSVPSLMTGLLPTATGVWHFSDSLRDEYLTLAEILRDQGFATASFLQNANAGPYAGLHQGFDALLDEELLGKSTEGILGRQLGEWLERHQDRSFFLNIHIIDPHGPFDPPPPWDRWYRGYNGKHRPVEWEHEFDPEWLEEPSHESRRTLYDGEIAHNDDLLGRFLAELDRLGLADDTMIIFVSDHGEYLGERGMWGHHPPGYLEVTNVPLMVTWPGHVTAGNRVPYNVGLIDVVPTVLEATDVPASDLLLQGDSLMPLLRGQRDERFWRNRVMVSEEPTRMKPKGKACGCGSLFFRDWHLINSAVFPNRRLPLPRGAWLRVYDFVSDRSDDGRMNLFRAAPLVGQEISEAQRSLQENGIAAWKAWTGGSSEMVQSDPDVRERLRALGYIE